MLQTNLKSKNILKGNKDLIADLNEDQLIDMFKKIIKYTDSELNDFDYKKAIKNDERGYFKYYISLVRINHLLFYSFYPSFNYNSRIIAIYLFFYNFTVFFFVNSLFFDHATMNKNKEAKFVLSHWVSKRLYSALISGIINSLIRKLVLTDSLILKLKHKSNKENIIDNKDKAMKIIKIKIIIFYVINLIVLVFIWLYVATFCAVYKNTQIELIKDSLISFSTAMIYPPIFYFLPGFFRMDALRDIKKDRVYMFKFSKLIQFVVSFL